MRSHPIGGVQQHRQHGTRVQGAVVALRRSGCQGVTAPSGRALQPPNVGGEALHGLTEVEDHCGEGLDVAHRDPDALATSKRSDSTSGVAGDLARCLGHGPDASPGAWPLWHSDLISVLRNPPCMCGAVGPGGDPPHGKSTHPGAVSLLNGGAGGN